MFKVNKSEFNVMVAITSHPVEALKNDQNTHKQKQDGLTNSSKCSPDPEKPEFGVYA